MPESYALKALRIDSAGYQIKIIQYCDEQDIEYAIHAKTSAAMRAQIEVASASGWLPLLNTQGEAVGGQVTCRTSFCIGDYEKAFTLIIQRTVLKGQVSLGLDSQESSGAISQGAMFTVRLPLTGMNSPIASLFIGTINAQRIAKTASRN